MDRNLPIETAKPADLDRNLPIETAKPADSGKIAKPNAIKLSAEAYSQVCLNRGYKATTIQNLKAIYDQIEANQVFGSVYLKKILECPERTARSLMAKLREMNVVVAVTGNGKGKYRFKNEAEEL